MGQSTSGYSIALAVVALLAGILIGVVGAHSFNITDEIVTEDVKRRTDKAETPAAGLRSSLNTLMVEHVYLSKDALEASYEDGPALEQKTGLLKTNSEELAGALGVLDDDTEEEFLSLWQEYNDTFMDYAAAAKKEDQSAAVEAEDNLKRLSTELAGLLAERTGMEEDKLQETLDFHTAHMQQVFNASVAGNHEEARQGQELARDNMKELSDDMSAAIVAKRPDKF